MAEAVVIFIVIVFVFTILAEVVRVVLRGMWPVLKWFLIITFLPIAGPIWLASKLRPRPKPRLVSSTQRGQVYRLPDRT